MDICMILTVWNKDIEWIELNVGDNEHTLLQLNIYKKTVSNRDVEAPFLSGSFLYWLTMPASRERNRGNIANSVIRNKTTSNNTAMIETSFTHTTSVPLYRGLQCRKTTCCVDCTRLLLFHPSCHHVIWELVYILSKCSACV